MSESIAGWGVRAASWKEAAVPSGAARSVRSAGPAGDLEEFSSSIHVLSYIMIYIYVYSYL